MIRLCEPSFDDADRARVASVLDSGMLVQGRLVADFESVLSARFGAPVVAVSNGTAALRLAMQALEIGPGDEVLVPGLTWPSAASVALLLGASVRVVDVDADTLCSTAEHFADAIGPKTRAIVAIHQFGIPAEIAEIRVLADAHDLRLIEDAACAIGTVCGDREAGLWGDLATFSFHPRKVVTTAEGGAIVCRDEMLVDRLRCLRNHGQSSQPSLLRFTEPGGNHRMSELNAAIGLGPLSRLDETLRRRRMLAAQLIESIDSLSGVSVPAGVRNPGYNVQSFVVRLDAGRDREAVLAGLRKRGVECTIGTYSIAQQPAFGAALPSLTPVSWQAMHDLITLPLHEAMSTADVSSVASALADILQEPQS
ncbi:MAG: perosamine synthetase [Bradymonadia bacterium]|jgi:perosamine synthetase